VKVIERIVYPWDGCAWPGEARMIRKEERMSRNRRPTSSSGSWPVVGLESRFACRASHTSHESPVEVECRSSIADTGYAAPHAATRSATGVSSPVLARSSCGTGIDVFRCASHIFFRISLTLINANSPQCKASLRALALLLLRRRMFKTPTAADCRMRRAASVAVVWHHRWCQGHQNGRTCPCVA
jgi:hypothetical protein